MPTIFRKTVKGLAEVETRVHRLAPRVRSMLILVDGKRDADELMAMVAQQSHEELSLLQAHGFIESVGETLPASTLAPVQPAARAAPVGKKPGVDFIKSRQLAVRALHDALGPPAATLAQRVERATSAQELRPLLQHAVQLVVAARGREAAEVFAAKLPSI
jgi:hypothetical protein